jgi:signal transduction histidine kinase/phage shock protein PspC (stress-responsive transcriptional regulator)
MDTSAVSFHRHDDGRVVAGVAAGFARHYGVDVAVVRAALVVLTFAAGLGLVLYAAGAVLSKPSLPEGDASSVPTDRRRTVAVGLVAAGLLLVVRSTGLWLGDAVMAVVVVLVAGVAVLAVVGDEVAAESRLAAFIAGRHARARVLVGAGFLVVGLVAVGVADPVSGPVRVGVFAAAISIVGVALLVGPRIARLAQAAAEERRQRIRSEEREAMAAHLHDSVLQTLALIQRNADDPRRTASLARQQEHELREWLFGGDAPMAATVAAAMGTMAREVEARYDVRVEMVSVGDAPLDDSLSALVAATREACVNAASHSGASAVSLFVEVTDVDVQAFVRDRGRGFDPTATGADRRGIAQSIVGRVERVGGTAEIVSSPGEGTEVQLRVPRDAAADGSVTA